jgi:excisionase family DNA binding protein
MGREIIFTADHIAAMLEVNRNTVYALYKDGHLKGSIVAREHRFPQTEVEKFLKEQNKTLSHGNYWVIEWDDLKKEPCLAIWHQATPDATPVRMTTGTRERQFSTDDMSEILDLDAGTVAKRCRSGEIGYAKFTRNITIPQVEVETYFAKLSETLSRGNFWVLEWEDDKKEKLPYMTIRQEPS